MAETNDPSTGVSKRKLTLAAQELASSNIKVLDVALKYGYETPESFAKAFRRVHGISLPRRRANRGPSSKLTRECPFIFH
jgi:AraC family transcriptional regulator